MDYIELRNLFLKFFRDKKHNIINNSSLIPDEDDESVLFISAGVQKLMKFMYNGELCNLGRRISGIQRCVRTDDINKVGDNYHLTFFEMLGNWSLGDYFKKESIEYTFEFLTSDKFLNLPVNSLAVSIFNGDKNKNISFDSESYNKWKNIGISESKIAKLDINNNWWGPVYKVGPCGPDTEVFFWNSSSKVPDFFDPSDDRWMEIWNNVFIEYEKQIDGSYRLLGQKNVDTGMGIERLLFIIQKKNNIYDTELFLPILNILDNIITNNNLDNYLINKFKRIIVDHLRCSIFIINDGIRPGNLGREYILRRLIRRAIIFARKLGIKNLFSDKIISSIINNYKIIYPKIIDSKNDILEYTNLEEIKFNNILLKGSDFLKDFFYKKMKLGEHYISGNDAFFMYATYGFPLELIEEYAQKYNCNFDVNEFLILYKKHQMLSRSGLNNKFRGGLLNQSDYKITKLHTATHILHAALKNVLNNDIIQKGSNINQERLRFDFAYDFKLTNEQIFNIESFVNDIIKQKLDVKCVECSLEEAIKDGAKGTFIDMYKNYKEIKAYKIGNYSYEICGGPHVSSTSELGVFKITNEKSSGKGIRRIKAILIDENKVYE